MAVDLTDATPVHVRGARYEKATAVRSRGLDVGPVKTSLRRGVGPVVDDVNDAVWASSGLPAAAVDDRAESQLVTGDED